MKKLRALVNIKYSLENERQPAFILDDEIGKFGERHAVARMTQSTEEFDKLAVAMAAAPELMTACDLALRWLQEERPNMATRPDEIIRELGCALGKARGVAA